MKQKLYYKIKNSKKNEQLRIYITWTKLFDKYVYKKRNYQIIYYQLYFILILVIYVHYLVNHYALNHQQKI